MRGLSVGSLFTGSSKATGEIDTSCLDHNRGQGEWPKWSGVKKKWLAKNRREEL